MKYVWATILMRAEISPACLTVCGIVILLLWPLGLPAQTTTAFDGATPPAEAPGSPDGSAALSGFDNVNFANGHLNFSLPLLKVPGRGNAQTTLMLPIDQLWNIQNVVKQVNCGPGGCQSETDYAPTVNWWNQYTPLYGAGSMVNRAAGDACAGAPPANWWINSLTRLTFTAPDGTEFELRDKNTGGLKEPGSLVAPYNRGQIFVTNDSSSAVFTADSNVLDGTTCTPTAGGLNGTLVTRNGLQYRIGTAGGGPGSGYVTKMTDRNGNTLTFNYDAGTSKLNSINDSFGRSTTIQYALSDGRGTYDLISYPGYQGASRKVTIYYDFWQNRLRPDKSLETLGTMFGIDPFHLIGASQYPVYGLPVPIAVVLDNNSEYDFFYDTYGQLARVELPTGGAYEYDYQDPVLSLNGSAYTVALSLKEKRIYSSTNPGQVGGTLDGKIGFTYICCTSGNVVTVQYYDSQANSLGKEVHTNYGISPVSNGASYPSWRDGREYQLQQYDSDGSTLLRTVASTWQQRDCSTDTNCWFIQPPNNPSVNDPSAPLHDPRLTTRTTTLEDSYPSSSKDTSKESFDYDRYNNQTEHYEYAFGANSPGSLVRETRTAYKTDSAYIGKNVLNLPASLIVYNGATTWQAETSYDYDETALTDRASIGQHDSSYGTTYIAGRGNPTTISKWLDSAGATKLKTTTSYDIAGSPIDVADDRGVKAHRDYTSPTYALPTAIKTYTALNGQGTTFIRNIVYDYNIGKIRTDTDINSNLTTYDYTDALDRLKVVTRPDTSQTTFSYDDTRGSYSVTTTTDQGAGLVDIKSTVNFDGLGRKSQVEQFEDGAAESFTDTSYDGSGRVSTVSNAYRTRDTKVFTTTKYDGIGRVISETAPDFAITSSKYAGSYNLLTDPTGANHRSKTDALGRVVEVVENETSWRGGTVGKSGTGMYTTTYGYDLLDDLKSVTQGSQSRTFGYDPVKRLASATQPETGATAVTYLYDHSGNLTSKTNGLGTISYGAYDGLNRPTSKTFSGATYYYCYDGTLTNCSGGIAPTGSIKGRLSYVGTAGNNTQYLSYNSRGWVTKSSQTTTVNGTATTYTFPSYQYSYTGAPTQVQYPSGRVVSFGYDAAGRTSSVLGTLNGVSENYAGAYVYAPHGGVKQFVLGNPNTPGSSVGIQETTTYNTRLQPTQILVQSGADTTLLSLGLTYQSPNNGNLQQQTITAPDSTGTLRTMTQVYTYDGLNRLLMAAEGSSSPSNPPCPDALSTWCQKFSDDQWGNRLISARSNLGTPVGEPTSFSSTSNRVTTSGWSYDGLGDMTANGTGSTFGYDWEGRQISATITGVNSAYTYDVLGRRVAKTTGGTSTVYVYDAGGELGAEYSTAGGGPPGTQYVSTDQLGSTRLVIGSNGAPDERHDYLPYGEEILAPGGSTRASIPGYGAATSIKQKFTGKERDSETGLDYFGARYYSGAQGRMTSPDAYGVDQHPEDPQSWNLYAYGRNNPLRFVDPNGEYVCGSGVDQTMCDNFQKALDAARDAANKLKETYGEKSTQYTDAQRAIDVYGKQNIDNGVTITLGNNLAGQGEVPSTVGTSAKTPDNPLGQKITAAFDASVFNGDYSANAHTVAHEGSHLSDESDWVRSGFSAAMNRTRTQTEDRALHVGAYVGMTFGKPVGHMAGNSPWYIGGPGWTPREVDTAIGLALWLPPYNLRPNDKILVFKRNTQGGR